jgi:AI-2 transport protein TqsA
VAVFLTVALAFLLTGFILLLLTSSVETFVAEVDQYHDKFLLMADWTARVASQFGYDLNVQTMRDALRSLPVFSIAGNFAGAALGLLGDAILIMLIFLFLILGGSNDAVKSNILIEIESKISSYVVTKTIISAVTGLLTALVLAAFGVELAVSFGFLAFVLNFIPNIGSVIAVFLPVPVMLLQFGLGTYFWLVLGITVFVQFLVGNVIEPKVVGHDMDLHPVTVLLFLIFWGLVWGLPGMFLAVPITALLKIALSRLKPMQNISEILAGRGM